MRYDDSWRRIRTTQEKCRRCRGKGRVYDHMMPGSDTRDYKGIRCAACKGTGTATITTLLPPPHPWQPRQP